MKPFIACGLMSGTSRDGIDVAFVSISGRFPDNKVDVLYAETQPYPWRVKEMLMVPHGSLRMRDVATLDFLLGALYGKAVLRAMKRARISREEIDVIGSHGQTLLHLPRGVAVGSKVVRSTLQVGSGAVIARTAGMTTVCDFRSADMAVGGEGAPLVPIYDYVVLRSRSKSRTALNIGGIANLTVIPRNAGPREILSFDTGPGNCMIDVAVRYLTKGGLEFDKRGAIAIRGCPDDHEVRRILGHAYFRRRPPKSTGWEDFGEDFTHAVLRRMKAGGMKSDDIISTITESVGASIAGAITNFVRPATHVDEIVVTGGGSKNLALMECLRRRLPWADMLTGEEVGINSAAKEASAFAYLAYLCIKRIPGNLMSQASGLKPAILGAVYPGSLMPRKALLRTRSPGAGSL